jgi:hypothetical protein
MAGGGWIEAVIWATRPRSRNNSDDINMANEGNGFWGLKSAASGRPAEHRLHLVAEFSLNCVEDTPI